MTLLSIKHIFGIRTALPNCIIYLDEHCYLYPSSRHIVFYSIDYKCQRLIHYGNEHDVLESLCVSPNKQTMAIAVNTLDKCRLIIYDIGGVADGAIKRRKIFSLKQNLRSVHVLSVMFSPNSKLLLSLYGSPDYVLVCWSIDQLKSITMISLRQLHIDLSHDPLNLKVSFNPLDACQFLLTGNHIYRRFHLKNSQFSSLAHGQYQRCESLNITCHCWLNENHVLLGIDTGFLCIINNHGDIVQRVDLIKASALNNKHRRTLTVLRTDRTMSEINLSDKVTLSSFLTENEHKKQRPSTLQYSYSNLHDANFARSSTDLTNIVGLLPFSRGVFVSVGNENSIDLTYLRRLILPSINTNDYVDDKSDRNNMSMNSSSANDISTSNELILSLALSPNEETLLVATNLNHIYEIAFSKMDYTNKEASIFAQALPIAHHRRITMGAICIRKSVLFTIGIDRSVKIWNLQTNCQEFTHAFDCQPMLISIHPMGLFVCVSFLNAVRLYSYTIDGLILFKELEIHHCQCIEYSHQGHMLAIAFDNILQFHSHHNYHRTTYLREHDKEFRLIRWAHDDSFILSVDVDEVIIRWDPYNCQRLSEYRVNDFSIQELILSSNNKLAYILSGDKKIKELQLMITIRDISINLDDFIPTALSIDDDAKMLFVGSEKGSILIMKLTHINSVDDKNTIHDISYVHAHQGAITKILVSFSNDLIISTGEDGTIVVYSLNDYQLDKESTVNSRDEIFAKEVLLKDQSIELNTLIKRETEITQEYTNNLEAKEKEYVDHFHQVDLHCQSQINEMKMKIEEFQQEKHHSKEKHEQKLNELIENNEKTINLYNEDKMKRYKEVLLRDGLLTSDMKNININEHQQIATISDLYKKRIESILLSYKEKINAMKQKCSQENQHLHERLEYLEDVKYFLDEDLHSELICLDEHYAKRLKIVRDQIEQLENEEVMLKLRLGQVEAESNRSEEQIKQFETERNQAIEEIQQFDNDLTIAKQTIEQRNLIIHEKSKRISEMENRQDELEKFAYVFNYKIRELTNEIGPRQHETNALIEQFNNMDDEYDLLSKNNDTYSIKIADCKARLKATEKELQSQTITVRKLNEIAAGMKEDFKLCCHLIDQPKQLIQVIRKIYGKYILNVHAHMDFGQMNVFDCERQRSYFERTNQRLQAKILLDIKRQKKVQTRRVQEQISMMREISTYSLKVLEVERILSDLDIVSNITTKLNITTTNEILHALKLEQGSDFIEQKQKETNLLINQQQKRIEKLRHFTQQLEDEFRRTYNRCETDSPMNMSSISFAQPTRRSSNSNHSQMND